MIGIKVVQQVRIECDRCGKGAGCDVYFDTIEEAVKFAHAQQFHIDYWKMDGCPRMTAFCIDCMRTVNELTKSMP
ncbi:MAG: hypothetical protein KGL39_32630 [Patescibacteria group bacterium]|nr:hypothetical protein [Patescibacteria group bacterium]